MKNFIVLSLLVVLQVLGYTWLSHGMRQIGEVDTLNPLTLLAIGTHVLTNPWIVFGVLSLIGAMLLYLTALSRLELGYVLPMTASSYVLTDLFAWSILHESISPLRWTGTLTVTAGVLILGLDEVSKSSRQAIKRSNWGTRSK